MNKTIVSSVIGSFLIVATIVVIVAQSTSLNDSADHDQKPTAGSSRGLATDSDEASLGVIDKSNDADQIADNIDDMPLAGRHRIELSLDGLSNESDLLPFESLSLQEIRDLIKERSRIDSEIMGDAELQSLEESIQGYFEWNFSRSRESLSVQMKSFGSFWHDEVYPEDYEVPEELYNMFVDGEESPLALRVGFGESPFRTVHAFIGELIDDPSQSAAFVADPKRFEEDLLVVEVSYFRSESGVVGDKSGTLYRPVVATFVHNPRNSSKSFTLLKDTELRPYEVPALQLPQAVALEEESAE